MYITFVEVQGMSLRNVINHVLFGPIPSISSISLQMVCSKANWENVGQIMLLPDAMCKFFRHRR